MTLTCLAWEMSAEVRMAAAGKQNRTKQQPRRGGGGAVKRWLTQSPQRVAQVRDDGDVSRRSRELHVSSPLLRTAEPTLTMLAPSGQYVPQSVLKAGMGWAGPHG